MSLEEFKEQARRKGVSERCKRCGKALEVRFPRAAFGTFMMVLTFLILGFSFSTFTFFGTSEGAIPLGVLLTAFASLIIGGLIGTFIFKIFCAYVGIELCHCPYRPWSKD